MNDLPKPDDFKPMHAEVVTAKPAPRPALNKFTELAAKLKVVHQTAHAEADKLSAEADELLPELMEAVGAHRASLQSQRDGIQDLKDAANVLSNFDPNAQSDN